MIPAVEHEVGMAQVPVVLPKTAYRDPLSAEQRKLIESELAHIVGSPHFKTSKRSVRLLSFVVDKALNGEAESIKERTVGVELFGRDPMFDTAGDATVRVAASEVRKRLAQFYLERTGSSVRIELPVGSYLPEFYFTPAPVELTSPPPILRPFPLSRIAALVLGLAAILLLFILPRWFSGTTREMSDFWHPMLAANQPVLICVGPVESYHAYPAAKKAWSLGKPAAAEASPLIGYPLVPMGDATALAAVTSFLTHQGKAFRLRASSEMGLADLRDSSAILIGASSNSWTRLAHGGLRYSIGVLPPDNRTAIIDRDSPKSRRWLANKFWPETAQDADYAVVSRMRDPNSGSLVITVAGMTPFGTQAAGEFLTGRDRLTEAVRRLPKGWQSKNVQFVIRTKIVGKSSGPPSVIATSVE